MERRKRNYWLHIKLLALYDSSICVQCFVLIFLVVFFLFLFFHFTQPRLDSLTNKYTYKQDKHFKVLQYASETITCISKPIEERHSFPPIKYQLTAYIQPEFFPLYLLFAGKMPIAHFSCINSGPFKKKKKFQRLRFNKSEKVITTTILTVYMCSLYIQYIL